MSEQDDDDRSERPSEKRLREAREKGQTPRSRDLQAAAIVGATALALNFMGNGLAQDELAWMRHNLGQISAASRRSAQELPALFIQSLSDAFGLILPLLAVCVFAAIAAPMLIGGWNFSVKAMAPDFSRVDPAKGLARLFSAQSLLELPRSLIKLLVVGGIAAIALWQAYPQMIALARSSATSGIAEGLKLTGHLFGAISLGLLLLGLMDAPYQLWRHIKGLRMTRQELMDEMKEAEGKPEVKSKLRQLQQQRATQQLREVMPTADVVVVNPTHFSVALRYTAGKDKAPVVIAKGRDELAATIRDLAKEHRIPLLSAPPLARVLYRSCTVGQTVPPTLYTAVAQVLTYVYQLRRWRPGQGRMPQPPTVTLPPAWQKKADEIV